MGFFNNNSERKPLLQPGQHSVQSDLINNQQLDPVFDRLNQTEILSPAILELLQRNQERLSENRDFMRSVNNYLDIKSLVSAYKKAALGVTLIFAGDLIAINLLKSNELFTNYLAVLITVFLVILPMAVIAIKGGEAYVKSKREEELLVNKLTSLLSSPNQEPNSQNCNI